MPAPSSRRKTSIYTIRAAGPARQRERELGAVGSDDIHDLQKELFLGDQELLVRRLEDIDENLDFDEKGSKP